MTPDKRSERALKPGERFEYLYLDSARRQMNAHIKELKKIIEEKSVRSPRKNWEQINILEASPSLLHKQADQSTGSQELNALIEVLKPKPSRGLKIKVDDRKASSRSTRAPRVLNDFGAYGMARNSSEKRPRTAQLYEATFEKEVKL